MAGEPERREISVRIPSATILKLLAFALLVWSVLQLAPILFLVVLSVLIAVALDPFVAALERRKLSRGTSTLIVGTVLIALLGLTFAFVVPRIASELSEMGSRLPAFRAELHESLAKKHPLLDRAAMEAFDLPRDPAFRAALGDSWALGHAAVGAMTGFALVVVLAIYFLYEGKRVYVWLLAYVPRTYRERMADTVPEVSVVMRAYIQGQAFTSFLAALFAGGLLWALDVPAVLPLMVLTAICDVIPFLGILVLVAVCGAVALIVSPWVAIGVMAALAAYHVFESYVIIPAVYGRKLRLSTLAVILALLVGGVLGGILGAVLVLPFVAAYPIIERIWLHDRLPPEVVEDHAALEEAAESGSDEQVERAIEAVEKGESPPPVH